VFYNRLSQIPVQPYLHHRLNVTIFIIVVTTQQVPTQQVVVLEETVKDQTKVRPENLNLAVPGSNIEVIEKPKSNSFFVRSDFVVFGSTLNSFIASRWFNNLQDTENTLVIKNTFDSMVDQTSNFNLSADAKRILTTQNAGGSSEFSEALSIELMKVLFKAHLRHTEMELKYWPLGSKITDYSMVVNDQVFGVSVTRAMKYKGIFEVQDAIKLLNKKLYGVIASSKAVIPEQRWDKQVLHIWAQHDYIYEVLCDAYENFIDDQLKSNTLVVITVAENAPWIFK